MTDRKKYTRNALKVVELFAGVGGFRLGLEEVKTKAGKVPFETIWANQWEPSTRVQHAADIYRDRFAHGEFSNEDIAKVKTSEIPDHDILVGGFPCQDYSVARTLNQAHGIIGKKGVLWWQIYRILEEKKKRPKYLLLENVDRLLKSPASQRGRDFAIMLASLDHLGYAVEWRVINAAEYGMPQRRRRVFILGYHKSTSTYKRIKKLKELSKWILDSGTLAEAFPVEAQKVLAPNIFSLKGTVVDISKEFNKDGAKGSPFKNAGIMINRSVLTVRTHSAYKGKVKVLKDVLQKEKEVPQDLYIDKKELPKWEYLKGAKNIIRKSKRTGKEYNYSEGSMCFPEDLNRPSRTIVTGEGGRTPSRFKHVVKTRKGFRRLTPIELERLNMFPDDHTAGKTENQRAFFMGNALVVGVVQRIGEALLKEIRSKRTVRC